YYSWNHHPLAAVTQNAGHRQVSLYLMEKCYQAPNRTQVPMRGYPTLRLDRLPICLGPRAFLSDSCNGHSALLELRSGHEKAAMPFVAHQHQASPNESRWSLASCAK